MQTAIEMIVGNGFRCHSWFMGCICSKRGLVGWIEETSFNICLSEVRDQVCHSLLRGGLEVPLVDGMSKDARVGESFHQLADVGGVGDGIIACCGKVAAGAAIHENHLNGSGWIPRPFEEVQVGIQVCGAYHSVSGDEVMEDSWAVTVANLCRSSASVVM